ncbi:LacI family DNA-binding transcriptional regulator [Streptomyces odontomachi]|uniref:LacI family DNA-binding transcriptional regulator n=1 Tax=Streptomyces odontomachi TaxID=2944940 RepID=UPI00210A6D34|nr:LacI family DNA-binding transcriptional regulator [Streptomyces sp. ODS25]
MATIKDVAKLAGVSLGTASRVLSGDSRTSTDARLKVTAAAAELNYIAHGPARSLRRARTDVVGLLVSDIRNPFFSDLAHAAEREARRHGYAVLLANANEDPEQESSSLRTFAAQRIDGLLIAPQGQDQAQFAALVSAGVPLVFVDRTVPGVDVPVVASDNAGGIRQAAAWLAGRGRQVIAFVGGPREVSTAAERLGAFLDLRDEFGFSVDERLVCEGDFRMESGGEIARRVFASGIRPDAFLVADGLMTLGVVQELHRLAGRGRDVDVVAFDDAPWFGLVSPPVSAVANDAAEIGRRGMRTLLSVIAGESPAPSRIPTQFIERPGS